MDMIKKRKLGYFGHIIGNQKLQLIKKEELRKQEGQEDALLAKQKKIKWSGMKGNR